jgi:hypothetical protein
MYKTIDFLFSYFVNMIIYSRRLNKKEFIISDVYVGIFWFFFQFIGATLGACTFVLVNLGITLEKWQWVSISLPLSCLISGAFVHQAKKRGFIENKLATIEPKSEEEMKKYCIRVAITKFLPFICYAIMLMFLCYLLQVFVFHRG